MAYDVVQESVALIEVGHAEPVRSLTRRRRFAAMAVDVSADVAVTMFARRGVGCIQRETHVLALRDRQWIWLGGGGGSSDERLLADRPAVLSGPSLLGPDAPRSTDSRIIAGRGVTGVQFGDPTRFASAVGPLISELPRGWALPAGGLITAGAAGG